MKTRLYFTLMFLVLAWVSPSSAVSTNHQESATPYDMPSIKVGLGGIAEDVFKELSNSGGVATTEQLRKVLSHSASLQKHNDPWSVLLSLDLRRLVDICLLNTAVLQAAGANPGVLEEQTVLDVLEENRVEVSDYLKSLAGKGALIPASEDQQPRVDPANEQQYIEQLRESAGRSYFKRLKDVRSGNVQGGDIHDYAFVKTLAQHDESAGIRLVVELLGKEDFTSDPSVRLQRIQEALLQNPLVHSDSGTKTQAIELVSLFEKYTNLDEQRFRGMLVYVLAPYMDDRTALLLDGTDNYLVGARKGLWDAPSSP